MRVNVTCHSWPLEIISPVGVCHMNGASMRCSNTISYLAILPMPGTKLKENLEAECDRKTINITGSWTTCTILLPWSLSLPSQKFI